MKQRDRRGPDESALKGTIADRLRHLRLLHARRIGRRLTQGELTREIGSKYAIYEREGALPKADALLGMGDFFGASTDYILGRTNVVPLLLPGLIVVDGDALADIRRATTLADIDGWVPANGSADIAWAIPSNPKVMTKKEWASTNRELKGIAKGLSRKVRGSNKRR